MCLLTCITRVSNSNWLADKTLLSFTSECTGQAVGYILEEDLATLSLDDVVFSLTLWKHVSGYYMSMWLICFILILHL